MNNKKILLILVLVFGLLMGGAYVLYGRLSEDAAPPQLAVQETPEFTAQEPAESEAPERVPLPDFTVYDMEGNEVHLSDFVGKPVVVNFWASWCGPCKMEMPDFDAAYKEQGEDIHFVMVNMTDGSRETVEGASKFIADQGYSFPVYYDSDMDAATTYGIYSIPTTLFIDAQGYGVAHASGAIDAATLQTGIDMIK